MVIHVVKKEEETEQDTEQNEVQLSPLDQWLKELYPELTDEELVELARSM